jgi:hypothetical protein
MFDQSIQQLTEQEFFRMNFIMQDTSASTTKTYLSKIVETVLFDAKSALDINMLTALILQKYSLEFSLDEVREIVKRDRNIDEIAGEVYQLSPGKASELSHTKTIEETLTIISNDAIRELGLTLSPKAFKELLMRFLYYSFNSNIDMIMSLVDGRKHKDYSAFTASNDEISIIDQFLLWDNDDKDRFIYQIVSYCYIYCSLTTKKDTLLSKNIFSGKKFYLDTNIIFRLAGVNQEDRQKTTTSFVKKCKEAGIKLYYTNVTMDELFRVIKSNVVNIKKITNSQEPLSPEELHRTDNDFYNIYCEWCKLPGNKYNDFLSFQQYLVDLFTNVLDSLETVTYTDYSIKQPQEYNNLFNSLRNYKIENNQRVATDKSVATDVNNFLYVLSERKNSVLGSVFSTNQFLISADRNLMNWAADRNQGVPVVVFPSVWLTILLRFSGRSGADDYKAFCMFMEVRTHDVPENFNIFELLKSINMHTSEIDIKKRVVEEIYQNQDIYKKMSFEDRDQIVSKAWEAVRKEYQTQVDNKKNEEWEAQKKQIDEKNSTDKTLEVQNERMKNASIAADTSADFKIQLWMKWKVFLALHQHLWVTEMMNEQ